jgi:hypothetical protein
MYRRTESIAEQFGDVVQYNIPIAKSQKSYSSKIGDQYREVHLTQCLLISETNDLLATTDINYVIPKYVKSLGYKAAEVAETLRSAGWHRYIR